MGASTTIPATTIQDRQAVPHPSADPAALKLALVIPTLREAGNIGGLLHQIQSVLEPTHIYYEIIVVDDDSNDGTDAIVSAMALQDPRIRLIVRKGERGLSGAVLDGWQQTDADILAVMDADLQHPPQLLPQLFQSIANGADLAIGSRYTPGGGLGDWNPMRKFLSAAAVWATLPIQRRRTRAKDPMSGFFMVRRNCVQGIAFQRAGFKLLLDILVRARISSVSEVPFAFGERFRGASKASAKVGWEYARLLARLYAAKLGLSSK